MNAEVQNYKSNGFSGFVTVEKLRSSYSEIPSCGGVYIVVRESTAEPQFLNEGTGGFFKGRNPNVAVSELQSNYVADSQVVYIGKATDLRKRIGQLIRFGAGSAVGHWGGRYLWQLKDSAQLQIAWKATPEADPRAIEMQMLSDFMTKHGKLPFANLTM